jgi:hypothetical protein
MTGREDYADNDLPPPGLPSPRRLATVGLLVVLAVGLLVLFCLYAVRVEGYW